MAIFVEKDTHYGVQYISCVGITFGTPVVGQTFQAGSSYTLTKITLRLRRTEVVNPIGLIKVNMYGVDGNGFPTGSSISSGQTSGNSITTAAIGEDRDIAMSPVSINSGTTYAIVLTAPEAEESGKDIIILLGSFDTVNGGYSGGKTVLVVNGTWEEKTLLIGDNLYYFDAYFKTWEEGDFRQVDTPTPTDTNTGISLTPNLQWQIDGAGTTVDNDYFFIYLNETGTFTNDDLLQGWRTSLSLQILSGLSVGTTYYWQVQAISENGDLLDSAVWSFTTSAINPPVASGGANPNGLNNMITLQRLVAAGRNKIFYEDI